MSLTIAPIDDSNLPLVEKFMATWLADYIISCGRKLYPAKLPGFVALDDKGEFRGMVTIEIVGAQCEVVTLDALDQWQGVGTVLLERAIKAAREADCKRLWLITTNDNVDAIRFYQKRGLTLAGINVNALEQSRLLKPEIPATGMYGIPIRDEILFEMLL